MRIQIVSPILRNNFPAPSAVTVCVYKNSVVFTFRGKLFPQLECGSVELDEGTKYFVGDLVKNHEEIKKEVTALNCNLSEILKKEINPEARI